MVLMSVVALFKGIQLLKKNNPLQLFNFLLAASLIDSFTYLILFIILKKNTFYWNISPILQSFYLFIELTTFTIFYFNYFKNDLLKKIISLIYVFFLIGTFVSILLGKNPFTEHYTFFVIIEILVVNISSIYIFKNVLNGDNLIIKKDIYLISKGIFIFINVTAPYYIISDFLEAKFGKEKIYLNDMSIVEAFNSINDIGYIILFYFIYKAFKWTKYK